VPRPTDRAPVIPARLSIDWLTDKLALGGCFPAGAAAELARTHRCHYVVDVREEACDDAVSLRRHGISLLHLPTEDRCAISPAMLARGVAWVRQALGAGGRVLIHCHHGIGRSALLALCVLVADGRDPLDAMTLIKDARPVVSPSPEQLEAFIAFVERTRRASGVPASVPTFDALAWIAYRHLRGDVAGGAR
jgi:predicted protein tyrosine phosphatase